MARRPNQGGAPRQIEGIESPETKFNKAEVRRRNRRLVVHLDWIVRHQFIHSTIELLVLQPVDYLLPNRKDDHYDHKGPENRRRLAAITSTDWFLS